MKKMKAPEMEVVHFGPGDVIATSGGGGGAPVISYSSSFGDSKDYAAFGKELNQGGYSGYNDSAWYVFAYTGASGAGFSNIRTPVNTAERTRSSYAWFQEDTNTWMTDNLQAKTANYKVYPTS